MMCSKRWPTGVSFGSESTVSDVEPWLLVVDAVTAILSKGVSFDPLCCLWNQCLSGCDGEGNCWKSPVDNVYLYPVVSCSCL